MASIRRGEVWLVNLEPTVGHEIKKARPAVVVQNNIGNTYSPITIIVPVTSQHTERVYPMETLLTPENSGIEKQSKALCNQVRAIDKTRLVKRVGMLTPDAMQSVNDALRISLSL